MGRRLFWFFTALAFILTLTPYPLTPFIAPSPTSDSCACYNPFQALRGAKELTVLKAAACGLGGERKINLTASQEFLLKENFLPTFWPKKDFVFQKINLRFNPLFDLSFEKPPRF